MASSTADAPGSRTVPLSPSLVHEAPFLRRSECQIPDNWVRLPLLPRDDHAKLPLGFCEGMSTIITSQWFSALSPLGKSSRVSTAGRVRSRGRALLCGLNQKDLAYGMIWILRLYYAICKWGRKIYLQKYSKNSMTGKSTDHRTRSSQLGT